MLFNKAIVVNLITSMEVREYMHVYNNFTLHLVTYITMHVCVPFTKQKM